jgi:MFS family permease
MYQAISGGMECVALSVGPLMAGAITDLLSWRAAFYVIVPVALGNIAAIAFFVDGLPQPKNALLKTAEKYKQIDILGFAFFLPATICLILTLQWGGTVYSWDSPRIIGLIIFTILIAVAFAYTQLRKGDDAMFPLHLLKQRSILLGSLTQFCISASLFVFCFYVSHRRQCAHGSTLI